VQTVCEAGRSGVCKEKERLQQEHNSDTLSSWKSILARGSYSARHLNMQPATNTNFSKNSTEPKKSTLRTQNLLRHAFNHFSNSYSYWIEQGRSFS